MDRAEFSNLIKHTKKSDCLAVFPSEAENVPGDKKYPNSEKIKCKVWEFMAGDCVKSLPL